MDDHGSTLLSIIHDVYGPPPLILNSNLGDAEISKGQLLAGSSTMSNVVNTSNSKSQTTLRVKKGAGSQRCSACRAVGHNSKYITPHRYCVDTYAILESNPQCPKKASMSQPTNSNQPSLSSPNNPIQISTSNSTN